MNKVAVSNDAEVILGTEKFDKLKSWYVDMVQSNCRYVVFLVRRCYMLSLLLEKITGRLMKDNDNKEKEYLTDAAFLLRCRELAEIYERRKKFPEIRLYDDILLHGRGFNHYILNLETEIKKYLPPEEHDEIKYALADAIKIYVYARNEGIILLYGRYEHRIEYQMSVSLREIHRLSDSISNIISNSGMANAAYIYSEELTPYQFSVIDKSEYIYTEYQNFEEYAKVELIEDEQGIKGISTLRIISDSEKDSYRVLPFVFISNLNEAETDIIETYINKKEKEKHALVCSENESVTRKLREWIGIQGKRNYNELISFILSYSLIEKFNHENGLKKPLNNINGQGNDEMEVSLLAVWDEIVKLSRNYNDKNSLTTKIMLWNLINTPLLSYEEVQQIVKRVVPRERLIFEEKEIFNGKMALDNHEFKRKLEKNFFEEGYDEECKAYQLKRLPYHETPYRSERVVNFASNVIHKLLHGLDRENIKLGMAYILQMMDAGILSVSSYPPINMIVFGQSQFIKVGEMALLTEPLSLCEYIPFLSRFHQYCISYQLDAEREFGKYYASGLCDIEMEIIQKLLMYVKRMDAIGQKVGDWNNNYLLRLENNAHYQSRTEYIVQMSDRQNAHIRCFEDYLNAN